MKKLIPLLALAALALPASAITNEELAGLAASNGFYRASVITTSGYAGSEVLTDFPVLVRIKPGSPSGFAYSDMMFPDSGKDLGFVDMEGNGLPFEIDTWRGANDESLVWVTLPAVSNSTQFAMVYRSSKAGKILSSDNPFATYTGVWHLNESGSGSASTAIKDASGKGFVGTAKGIAVSVASGKLGGSWNFNNAYARNDAGVVVDLSDSTKLNTFNTELGDTFHVSLWICPHGDISKGKGLCWNVLIGHKEQSATPAWGLSFNETPDTMRIYSQHNNGNSYASSGNIVQKGFKKNTWGKLDVVYYTSGTSGKFDLYFNGTNVTSEAALKDNKPAVQGSSSFGIGCFTDRATDRSFFGEVDEVRLLAGKTSSDRIRADYDTIAKASFLAAAQVVAFQEPPKPVFGHEVADVGAAFVQFSGSISVLALGGSATSCEVLAKAWPTDEAEPAEWTTIATGLSAGASFKGTLTGLSPLTGYTYKIKAVNNIPYDSDIESDEFETSGVGDAGTGGAVERQLDEFVHTFVIAPDGTDTFSFTPPADVDEVDALVVGGGGPGGYYAGGGGGGGGLVYTNAMRVTGGATYTVTVGAGGEHATSATAYGTNGGDSSIVGADVSVTAVGGGAGGNGKLNNQTATLAGAAGGSGGGASWKNSSGGAGTAGQGNAGGTVENGQSASNVENHAGGGGGAAKAGSPAVGVTGAQSSGAGGDGLQVAISGVPVYYAGGGGGGGNQSNLNGGWGSAGGGGGGGGGRGGQYADSVESATAESGADNLGGGGGGGSTYDAHYLGGDGGNGIVIIRYGAGGDGQGATAPTVSLTGLDYDSGTGKATLDYRVAWAGSGYQEARVSAIWGYAEDALLTTNLLETSIIGAGSGEIELPSVSRTVYVRVVAENAGGATGVSPEILSVVLYNPRAPEATAPLASPVCTNAVFSVDVTNLGQGAANATVSIQVARNLAFTGDVLSFPDQTIVTATGAATASAWGLDIGTTYYARAVVSNDIHQVYETDAVRFTTLVPGPPYGTASNGDPGYTTFSAFATTTDFGVGSGSAAMRLEVSTAADFATFDSVSPWLDATIDQQDTLTAVELLPDTAYHARVCLSNWWGEVTYLPLVDTATRAVPFASSGLAFTAGAGDTIDFSFPVTALYDGATVTATLSYAGAEVGTESVDAAPATLSWAGVAAAAETATATVVATATLPGGETIEKAWTISVVPGSSVSVVADVTAHASAVNALWMRPGEVAILPPVAGSGFYQVLNPRFAAVEGNTLKAFEPGIVGVRCVDANAVTNVMGVVVLPDAIGSGSVYVFKETKRKNTDDWARSECWDKVENGARAATNDSFPQHADDIAILPFYNATGDLYIRHTDDITLGGLYAGQIRPDAYVNCCLERFIEVTTKTVTFRRTDGEAVHLTVCPNGENGVTSSIQFGGYDINVAWVGDILIDGCSSETDVNGPRGLVKYKDGIVITNTAENATITVQGLPGYGVSGTGGTTKFNGVWKGAADFVKKGQGSLVLPEDISGLSGIVRDMTGPTLGNITGNAAGVLMRAAGASNFAAHVYGYAAYDRNTGAMSYNGLSRGLLGTGGQAVGPEKGSQGPAKGLHLHGGTYKAFSIGNDTWGVGVADEKAFDVLGIGAGFSYVTLQGGPGNDTRKPINAVTAKTLAQTDKGTLVLFEPSLNNNARQTVTNNLFRILDWADHAIGGPGYGENGAAGATNDFTIIPWMVANGDDKFSWLMFPAVDANGRLVRPIRTTSYIDTAGAKDNAIWSTDYGSLTRGSGTDFTVNSLFLNNSTKGDRWLGADRTLTITSGGLIFNGNGSAIGLPGRTDNGKLVLGDATHPAYVWAKAYGNGTNYIWAAVTAPGGFVSTYTGNLELGGDQTGIAGEIAVNGGTLALGDSEHGIELRDDLPVRVCAGAALKVVAEGALDASPVLIDGSAGAFGRIELPGDRRCASLSIRDVFESDEWETLPRGTWGATGSGADFVRDDLFSGPGVLSVDLSDEPEPEFEAVEWIPELATERTGTFRVEAIWLGMGATSAGLDAYVLPAAQAEPWDWTAAEPSRQALATFVSRTNATFVVRGLEPDTAYAAMFVLSNVVDGAVHATTNGPVAFRTIVPDLRPTATCRVDRAWALAADLSVVVPRFGFEAPGLSSLTLRYGTDPADESGWTSVALDPPATEGATVPHRLLGLAAGTTYYAKVDAVNTLEPAQSFTTPEALAFATASGDPADESQPCVDVSSVAPAREALHVAASVRWTGFGAETVRVLYRVATSEAGLETAQDAEAFATLGEGDDASFDIPGLTPGTRYWVRVFATNALGARTASAVFSAAAYGETMTTSVAGAARTFDVGRDRVAVFTNSAETLAFSTVEGGPVELLVVGGGGAGGSYVGGGGGGGGFLHLDSLYLEPGTTYSISVGAGGRPTATDQRQGGSGGDSSFAGGTVALVAHGGGGGGGWGALDGLPGGSGGGAANNRSNGGIGRAGASTASGDERGNTGGENDTTLAPRIEKLASGGGGAGAPGSHAEYGAGIGGAGGDGLPCSITGEEVWYAGGGGAGQYWEQWQSTDVTVGGATLTYLPGTGGRGGGGMGCSKDDDVLDDYECGVDGLGGGGGGGRGQGSAGSGMPRMGAPGGSGTVIVRWRAVPAAAVRAEVSSVAGSARAAIVEGTALLGGTAGATVEMRVAPAGGSFGAWRVLASGLADGEAFAATLDELEPATRYDYEIRTTDGSNAGETLGAATGSFSTYYTWPARLAGPPEGAITNAVGSDMVYAFPSNGTYTFTVESAGYARLLMVGGGGAGGSKRGGGGGAGGFLEQPFATLEAGTYTVVVGAGGVPAVAQSLNGAGDVGGDGGETILRRDASGETVYRVRGGGGGGSYYGDKDGLGLPGNAGGSGGGGGPKNPAGGGAATATPPELGSAGGGALSGNTGNGDSAAGGGGGAGGPGGNGLGTDGATGANRRQGGAGGAGVASDITGESRWYAAGGGGGCWSDENGGYKGLGGSGVGGDGGGWSAEPNQQRTDATAGADGTGSGGGGGGAFYENQGCRTNRVNGGTGGCGAFILRVASSSDYRPAAEVETLSVRDGEPTTVDATVSLRAVGFGGAPTVTLLYGPEPDVLAFSVPVASGAAIGVYAASIPGLTPGATWYFAAAAENSRFATTGLVRSVTLPAAPAPQGEPGAWGLWQTQRRGEEGTFRDLFASDTLWDEAQGSNLVAGAIAANTKDATFADPASGRIFSWGGWHMLYAYRGWIYLDGGKSYAFGSRFANCVRLAIDGETLIDTFAAPVTDAFGTFATDAPGWHEIDARVGRTDAAWGPDGNGVDSWIAFGLAFNDAGYQSAAPIALWTPLVDPGDGSLLRPERPAARSVQLVSATQDGAVLSLAGLAGAGAEPARAFVVRGGADAGTLSTNDWDEVVPLGTVNPADAASALAATVTGWGGAAKVARFALETAGEWTWSAPATFLDTAVPSLSAVKGVATDDGDTIAASATVSGGTAPYRATLWLGADADSLAAVASATIDAPGPFALEATGLAPGATYWWRIVLTDQDGLVVRSDTMTVTTSAASRLFDASDGSETAWKKANAFENRQRTIVFGGQLAALGAGETTVRLLRNQSYDGFPGARTTEPHDGEELVLSSIGPYELPVELDWDLDVVYNWSVSNGTARASWGPTASARDEKGWFQKVTVVDATAYTWTGGSFGTWTNAAAWTPDGVWGDEIAGYPRRGSYAVFPAGTFTNAVPDAPEGLPSHRFAQLDLSSGADVTFVTAEGASAPELVVRGETDFVQTPRPCSIPLGEGAALRFRGIRAKIDGSSALAMGAGSTLEISEGSVVTVGNNPNGGYPWNTTVGANVSFVFRDSDVMLKGNAYVAGTGTRMVVDNARVSQTFHNQGTAIVLNAPRTPDGATLVVCGADPGIEVASRFWAAKPDQFIDFVVPEGGWTEAPIRPSSHVVDPFGTGTASGNSIVLRVPADSPAVLARETLDVPLVRSPGGVDASVVLDSGNLPHPATDRFFTAADPATGHTVVWAHLVGQADTDEPQAVDFRVASMAQGTTEISFVAIPGRDAGGADLATALSATVAGASVSLSSASVSTAGTVMASVSGLEEGGEYALRIVLDDGLHVPAATNEFAFFALGEFGEGESATAASRDEDGPFTVWTFTNTAARSQTFTVTKPGRAEILVVGGGGSGGSGGNNGWSANYGGGGGGGGETVATNLFLPAGDYRIEVGAGGPRVAARGSGAAGGVSRFDGVVARGGGAGGSNAAGGTGANGGGGGGGGARSGGAPFDPSGHAGGANAANAGGGGGGGAAGDGAAGDGQVGGAGGSGVENAISGLPVVYGAGGGGGGGNNATLSAGGAPGAENAGAGAAGVPAVWSDPAVVATMDAVPGFGGGGGGGAPSADSGALAASGANYGGAGGSGVVIVRMRTATARVPEPQALLKGVEPGVGSVDLTLSVFSLGQGASSADATLRVAKDGTAVTNAFALGTVDATGWTNLVAQGLCPATRYEGVVRLENGEGGVLELPVEFETQAETGTGPAFGAAWTYGQWTGKDDFDADNWLRGSVPDAAYASTGQPSSINQSRACNGADDEINLYSARRLTWRWSDPVLLGAFRVYYSNGDGRSYVNVASVEVRGADGAWTEISPEPGHYDATTGRNYGWLLPAEGAEALWAEPVYGLRLLSDAFAYSDWHNLREVEAATVSQEAFPADLSVLSVSRSETGLKAAVGFSRPLQAAATVTAHLAAEYGAEDLGAWTEAATAQAAADARSQSFSIPASALGGMTYLRFRYVDANGAVRWSESVYLPDFPAAASVPPAVAYVATTGTTAGGATLVANLLEAGAGAAAADLAVRYAIRTNDVDAATPVSFASGAAPGERTGTVSGLLPAHTYYARFVATSAAGEGVSDVFSFTTTGTPATPADPNAVAIADGGVVHAGDGATAAVSVLATGSGGFSLALEYGLRPDLSDATVTNLDVSATGDYAACFPAAPNAANYYRFVATADGGAYDATPIASFTTRAGSELGFNVSHTGLSHHTATLEGRLPVLGAGTTTVYVYAGSDPDALEPVDERVLDAAGAFSFEETFPGDPHQVWYAFKSVNVGAGGTEWTSWSATNSLTTVDAVIYTWNAAFTEGSWTNAACWTPNAHADDCFGYPAHGSATAVFTNGTKAVVAVPGQYRFNSMSIGKDNVDVTFVGEDADVSLLACNITGGNMANSRWTFSALVLEESNGVEFGNKDNLLKAHDSTLTFTDGAVFRIKEWGLQLFGTNQWLVVEKGASVQATNKGFVIDGTVSGGIRLDDGTINARYARTHGQFAQTADQSVFLSGEAPRIVLAEYYRNASSNAVDRQNDDTRFVFSVPVAGWTEAPIFCDSATAEPFAALLGDGPGRYAFSVDPGSPLVQTPRSRTVRLLDWRAGIDESHVSLEDGRLASGVRYARLYYVYGWGEERTEPIGDELPTGIRADIRGLGGTLLIFR